MVVAARHEKRMRWLVSALMPVLLGATAGAHLRASVAYAGPTHRVSEAEAQRTGLDLRVTPEEVEIYVDGKKRGTAGELTFIATRPGTHEVRLVRGGDELQVDIVVKKNQVVQFTYEFE